MPSFKDESSDRRLVVCKISDNYHTYKNHLHYKDLIWKHLDLSKAVRVRFFSGLESKLAGETELPWEEITRDSEVVRDGGEVVVTGTRSGMWIDYLISQRDGLGLVLGECIGRYNEDSKASSTPDFNGLNIPRSIQRETVMESKHIPNLIMMMMKAVREEILEMARSDGIGVEDTVYLYLCTFSSSPPNPTRLSPMTKWQLISNAMGTSVGSGALMLLQAVFTATMLEFSEALLMGTHAASTMQKGLLLIRFKDP
uniref:Uncharacterized protein n=1 Tax=Vitis vinifera TaxID=29760 RepID=A5BT83_VITVI|nr:hypothetical protein VITISV_043837 [Vitis vinifera]